MDLTAYDGLRQKDAVAATPEVTLAIDDGGIPVTLRHLVAYLSFSLDGYVHLSMINDSVGALLAVYHFNNGIDSVVPQIKNATTKVCPDLKFTHELVDTKNSPIATNRHMVHSIFPRENHPLDPTRPYPTALLGASRSAVSMPLHQLAAAFRGLVQLSHASSATDLDNKDQYPLFGRTIPSTLGDATAAVDYMAMLGVTHFGVLHVQDPYGFSYASALTKAASQRDPPIKTISASFPFKATDRQVNYGPLTKAVTRLRKSGYRYFFGVWFTNAHDATMRELHRQGITGKEYFWMFGDSLDELPYYEVQQSKSGGATNEPHHVVAATTGTALLSVAKPSVLVEAGVSSACAEAWQKFIQDEETKSYLHSALPNHKVDGDKIEATWNKMQLSNFPRATGSTLYDATMAIQLAACELHSAKRARGGDEMYGAPTTFTGSELYETYLRINFRGRSGKVITDPSTGTRDYETVAYTVKNIVANLPDKDSGVVTFSAIATGLYYEGTWNEIGSTKFVYSDGTTEPPNVLPPLAVPHNYNSISPIAQGLGWALCGVIILLSVGWAMWTLKLRSSPVVKASQPIFLSMLCIGVLFMGSSIVPMSLQETNVSGLAGLNAACMAWPWLLSLGFTVSFSALQSKLKRIIKIIGESKKLKRVKVLPKDVIKTFITLLCINLTILIAWTVVAPLQWHRINIPNAVDTFGRGEVSYGTCFSSQPTKVEKTFIGLWIIPNVAALVCANVQANRGQHISTEYSEARYIKVSMAFLLQPAIIGLPLAIISKNSPTTHFVALTFLVVIICLSILIPVFVPKMIYYRAWKVKQAEKAEKKKLRLQRIGEKPALARRDVDLVTPERTQKQLALGEMMSSGRLSETTSSGYGLKPVEREEPLRCVVMRARLSALLTENLLLKQKGERLQQQMQRNLLDKKLDDEYDPRMHSICVAPVSSNSSRDHKPEVSFEEEREGW